MYYDYWQLKRPPFEIVPDTRFVYYSENHHEALMRLMYTVKSNKGACLLTGDVGCGKTTISKVFQEKLAKEGHKVGLVLNPNLPGTELIEEILHSLNFPVPPSRMKVDLLRALVDGLKKNLQAKTNTILILDEAHLINDTKIFEELRLLLNYYEHDTFLVTLILVGQPELKNSIRKSPQFEQRIPIKYHLNPLNLVDASKYIYFRLKKAGSERQIFTLEAVKLIYKQSQGIPRVINTLCDMCLLAGFLEKAPDIDHLAVEKVIKEEG